MLAKFHILNSIFLVTFSLVLVFFGVLPAIGQEFSSTNFKVLDPVIQPGGYSTSDSYQLNGAIGQIAIGTSTASNFSLNSGFLYYPFISSTTLFAYAGNSRVYLGWTTPSGFLGWTPSGYNVGQSTTQGGPYTYASIGNYAVSERTGLTNGTTYYFVVRIEDALGNFIATSSEAYAVPIADVLAIRTIQFPTTSASSTVFTNSNGTQLAITFPSNFYSSCGNVHTTIFSESKSVVTADKSLPTAKEAANTFYDASFKCSATAEAITSLDKELTLTFTYTDADIAGLNENNMAPYRWDGSSWVLLSGATIDTGVNTITVSSKNFSFFGLFSDSSGEEQSGSGSSTSSGDGILLSLLRLFIPPKVLPPPPLLPPQIKKCGAVDYNCDNAVDLRDFSIFLHLSNYSAEGNPGDLNQDGRVGLADTSIFLYRWTEKPGYAYQSIREKIRYSAELISGAASRSVTGGSKLRPGGIQAETAIVLEQTPEPSSFFSAIKDAFIYPILKIWRFLVNLLKLN